MSESEVVLSEVDISDADGFLVVKPDINRSVLTACVTPKIQEIRQRADPIVKRLSESFDLLSVKLQSYNRNTTAVMAALTLLLVTAFITFSSVTPHHLVHGPQVLYLNSTLPSHPRSPVSSAALPTGRVIPRDVFARPQLPIAPNRQSAAVQPYASQWSSGRICPALPLQPLPVLPVVATNRVVLEQMVWKLWGHRHPQKAVCAMKRLQELDGKRDVPV